MFKPAPWIARLLPALLLLPAAMPANAQVKALRSGDDQYIKALRDEGMSDLLQRFVEVDPPEDPIARLALDVALKQFVADDLLARAQAASRDNDFAKANDLFAQSRTTYEGVLAAQRQMVADNKEDERLPIWQTEMAEMLLELYLPRYYQNAPWHYAYGIPEPEQKEAFEKAAIESLVMTSQAVYSLDLLANRVGVDAKLRPKLEEMGIWYALEDHRSINTPYWHAHAAHYVSLLPDDHTYFKEKPIRGQRSDANAEKVRLRNSVLDAISGGLLSNDRTERIANLLAGRTLVRSSKLDDIDEGVEEYLDKVAASSSDTWHGYLATMSKAIGRWNASERSTANEILSGMANHKYVEQQTNAGNTLPRLLAADLHFRLLEGQAQKAVPAERPKKIAEAYEQAYIPLLASDQDAKFKNILFTRWAAQVNDSDDPATLPPTVRMGIGEQLTQEGGSEAQQVTERFAAGPPAIPAEAAAWKTGIQTQAKRAQAKLRRAVRFNTTLIGEDMEGPVLARGLYNLGMNQYWLAELAKVLGGDPNAWQPYFKVAQTWVEIARRTPDDENAKPSLTFAIGLVQQQDVAFNSKELQSTEVRALYKEAFELFDELWPNEQVAHNNRVYAAFQLYEKLGDLEKAVETYRKLPPEYPDYFQARRQMIYALHRLYKQNRTDLLVLESTKPMSDAPPGATPEAIRKLKQQQIVWETKRDAIAETLDRQRDNLIEDAELAILDAKDEAEAGRTPARRFSAATALGAATVVLAGLESDEGSTHKALELLDGFQARYAPDGPYAQLAKLQAQPDTALATLQGLVQSAQQERILALLAAKQTDAMAQQAREMMEVSPDVAASVVNGVLQQIRATIEVQQRIAHEAPFDVIREKAEAEIKFQASAAVALSELLVQWAGNQGFDDRKMIAYRMPLADALMLAGRPKDAVQIMDKIVKEIPNNFDIAIRTGRAYLALYAQTKVAQHYNKSMEQFTLVVNYYNARPEKPSHFWEAWLGIFRLMDTAGKPQSEIIPKRARMLFGFDEEFGGPAFKSGFMDIIDRNGGIERLPVTR